MPKCHDKKKMQKHSGYQENRTFTETINSYFPHKDNTIYKT